MEESRIVPNSSLTQLFHLDVAGEYVRQDITDNEPGVPLIVDLDVFDVETCEPIPDLYVEIWSKSTLMTFHSLTGHMLTTSHRLQLYRGVLRLPQRRRLHRSP